MCGIAGFIRTRNSWGECEMEQHIRRMTATLSHRGPDSSGVWIDRDAGVALGHARLAILDLSSAGHQPMHAQNGRYAITYNGEIYNCRMLAEELEGIGIRFRGTSDTEILLEAISQWGVTEALGKCNGMFAFALWDKAGRKLVIARDRMGKKPVYYGWCGKSFVFSSELRGLHAFPEFDAQIDRDALASYFRYSYIPTPYSIYRGISKLEPGCIVTIDPRSHGEEIECYWSLEETARHCYHNQLDIDEAEAVELLDEKIRESVRLRMVSDVPLGAFLSGGVDSSTVVAHMHGLVGNKTKTFTIGYEEERYNEAPFARAIAERLGTDHTELLVKAGDVIATIPELANIYDEPFSDISQLPSYIVCRLARQDVTVCLSGDGGDEFFCGYDRYFSALDKWGKIDSVPGVIRRAGAGLVQSFASQLHNNEMLARRAQTLRCGNAVELFLLRSERMYNAERLVPGSSRLVTRRESLYGQKVSDNQLEQMMYIDAASWLMDDILVKMDRASMANSLEVRNPLLDYNLVSFALSLPIGMKVRNGQRKYLLKQCLFRHLPEELIERPKRGFAVPISEWLRGPLKDWAETLIESAASQGVLDMKAVGWLWKQFLGGNNRYRMVVWSILMFQAWMDQDRNRV